MGVLNVSTVFMTAVVISWRDVYGKQMFRMALQMLDRYTISRVGEMLTSCYARS